MKQSVNRYKKETCLQLTSLYLPSFEDVDYSVSQSKHIEEHQQSNWQNKRVEKGPRFGYETFRFSSPCKSNIDILQVVRLTRDVLIEHRTTALKTSVIRHHCTLSLV